VVVSLAPDLPMFAGREHPSLLALVQQVCKQVFMGWRPRKLDDASFVYGYCVRWPEPPSGFYDCGVLGTVGTEWTDMQGDWWEV
jgi:hypothetical protein